MQKNNLTAVIIARNEEAMILNCIDTLKWCEAILVIDNGSTDATSEIAEMAGATVVAIKSNSFARTREEALKYVKTGWVFYIDADERVSPSLAKELSVKIETNVASAFTLLRKNYFEEKNTDSIFFQAFF